MSKAFTKGQPVTFLQNWDSKGTVRIADLIVHSCGAKQMVLVDEAGAKFEGKNFLPGREQYSYGLVVPRLSPEAAEAAALELGAAIVVAVRNRLEKAIAHYGYPETDNYTKSIRQDIEELHEPRIARLVRHPAHGYLMPAKEG